MLILFDIDRTLLETRGVGMVCLQDAGRSLFGDHLSVEGIEFGGRLDLLIIGDILERAGVIPSPENIRAMRAAYAERLALALDSGATSTALAGTHQLVDALGDMAEVTLGLLTGNFEETGRLKLGAAGFDIERFPVRVWGDDSPHFPPVRDHLPPIGIERHAALKGVRLSPDQVVIIGDTIHDVSCALAHGCRVLAVATGHNSAAELAAAGAHRVVKDLSRTGDILAWLTEPTRPNAIA
ncbi:MAG: HAD family hydrolase [Planctomycetota bacterium]|nr:MAG: HAD family hydrolase [Planctomycetota bacterium]